MTWETRKAHGPSCIDPVEVGLGLKGATRERERETYPSSGRNFKNSPALTHGLSFPPLREPCLSFLLSLKLHPSNAIEIRTTIKMREKRGEEIELVKRKEKKKIIGTIIPRLEYSLVRSRAGELRAGCATGRRTFKLMTFNAKLYCARRAWNEG